MEDQSVVPTPDAEQPLILDISVPVLLNPRYFSVLIVTQLTMPAHPTERRPYETAFCFNLKHAFTVDMLASSVGNNLQDLAVKTSMLSKHAPDAEASEEERAEYNSEVEELSSGMEVAALLAITFRTANEDGFNYDELDKVMLKQQATDITSLEQDVLSRVYGQLVTAEDIAVSLNVREATAEEILQYGFIDSPVRGDVDPTTPKTPTT